MIERRLVFNPELYKHYWQPLMRLLYGISGIINIVLIWQMFFDIPTGVNTQEIPAYIWYDPIFLLMLINTVGIAGYSAYRYYKFQKLRALSHVTLVEGAVIHYIQEPFMSDELARMALEGKWKSADSKEFYAAYLRFRITKVTKLRYNRFGAIILEGTIERTYHDEYLQVEEGNGYTVMTVNKYKIHPYYEGMDEVYSALERLSVS